MDAMEEELNEVEPIMNGQNDQNDMLAIRSNLGYSNADLLNRCFASHFRALVNTRALEISQRIHSIMYHRAIQMQHMQPQYHPAIMGRINFAAAANPFMVHGSLRQPSTMVVTAPYMNGMNPTAFMHATQQQPPTSRMAIAPSHITLPSVSQLQANKSASLKLEDVDHSFNPNPNDYTVLYDMMKPFCDMFGCQENRRPHIVEFIFNELMNFESRNIIQWTGLDGSFKVNNPQELAHRWGMTKGSKNMTYEKMSRSIRNYYRRGTISKIRHHYCYRINLNELGVSSDQTWIRNFFLARRAEEEAAAAAIQSQPSPPTSVSDPEDGGVDVEEMNT